MNKMLKPMKDTRLENENALKGAAMFLLIIGTISSIALGLYLYSFIRWIGIVVALLNEAIVYASAYFLTVVAEISTTLKNKTGNNS